MRIPKYKLMIDEIKAKVNSGELKPHDYLGTQVDLAKKYRTSEITSRRALDELSNEGIVYRVKGKGTYIQEGTNSQREPGQAKSAQPGNESADGSSWSGRGTPIHHIYVVSSLATFPEHIRTMLTNRYFIDTWRAMAMSCQQQNIGISMIANSEVPEEPEPGTAFVFMLSPSDHSEVAPIVKRLQGSVVTIHGYFPHLEAPYVICDNLTGGYTATHHLIAQGHKDIAVILTGTSMVGLNQEFSLRFQGHRLAMQQHSLPVREDYVILTEGDDESAGYDATMRLLQLPSRPTAVFYSTDRKAAGGLFALHSLGIGVPEEMSVIGYDDQYFSEYLMPPLTTVNQNAERIGKRAIELLLANARTGKKLKDEIVPTLVVRNSVGPPPQV